MSAPENGDWHNRARLQRIWLALEELQRRNLARAGPNAFRYAECPIALDLSFEIWFRGGTKEENRRESRTREEKEEITSGRA